VARFGDDRTTLVLRQGRRIDQLQIGARHDTMTTVGTIVDVLDRWQVDEIDVDIIGIGSGVYDRLAELRRQGSIRCAVVAVNVAEAPPLHPSQGEPRPRRLRDYLWLTMAAWLREEEPIFAAEDRQACEDLAGEVACVKYGLDSNGYLVIESKDEMKRRLGHSPDLADGLACTFAPVDPLFLAAVRRAVRADVPTLFGGTL
jgi:phage terminase large subunit